MGPDGGPVIVIPSSMARPHCLVGGVLFFLAVASSSAQYVQWHRHDAGQAAQDDLHKSMQLPGTADAGLMLASEKAGETALQRQAALPDFRAQEQAISRHTGRFRVIQCYMRYPGLPSRQVEPQRCSQQLSAIARSRETFA